MSDLSFRQRAAQQGAIQQQARLAQEDARRPFSAAMGSVSIALRACIGRPCYIDADGVERRTAGDQIVVALSMSNARGAMVLGRTSSAVRNG